jgi:hypothetical protein
MGLGNQRVGVGCVWGWGMWSVGVIYMLGVSTEGGV